MKHNFTIKELALVGMGAAMMGVFSQMSIPLPFTTVPLTLQNFGLVLIAVILEHKLGTLSMIVWVLLGIIGIPVFSRFSGGVGVIVGPTGGYIIGFIFMTFIIGYATSKKNKGMLFLAAYLGQAIEYSFGVMQLKFVAALDFKKALAAGVYPFIVKDIILVTVSVVVALNVKRLLKKTSVVNLKA